MNLNKVSMRRSCKNLLVLSVGWTLLYSSFSSLKDISSSIHHIDGLGLFCMASFYTGYMIACIFAYPVLRLLDTRISISCAALSQIPFVISNALPEFYVLLPLSFLSGFTQALLWTGSGVYLVWIVKCLKESSQDTNYTSKVFSTFYFVTSCSPILGGFSTVILFSRYSKEKTTNLNINELNNTSFTNLSENVQVNKSFNCGPGLCYDKEDLAHLGLTTLQRCIILGYYTTLIIIASVMFLCLMDSHHPTKYKGRTCFQCTTTMLRISEITSNRFFLTAAPLMLYYGFQMAFVSGSFFQAYAGCRYGIEKLGYFLVVFGFSSALSSGLSGLLKQIIGREYVLAFACMTDITALLGMVFWNLLPTNILVTLGLCCMWGLAHGIWQTNLNGFVGELFPGSAEVAFSSFNLILSVGIVIGYGYAHFTCVLTRLYVTGALCLLSTLFYIITTRIIQQTQE